MNEYQTEVWRTAGNQDAGDTTLLLWTVALSGEVGEFCNVVKKIVGHDHQHRRADLGDELGDVLWYVTAIATHLGLDLEKVAAANVEKLRRRYPDGFDTERSKNREE